VFKIRKEHLRALSAYMRKGFEERLADRLCETDPDMAGRQPRAVLLGQVHASVEQALDFGLRAEEDVTQFVLLALPLGKNLDNDPGYPGLGSLLRSSNLRGDDKIAILQQCLREQKGPSEIPNLLRRGLLDP